MVMVVVLGFVCGPSNMSNSVDDPAELRQSCGIISMAKCLWPGDGTWVCRAAKRRTSDDPILQWDPPKDIKSSVQFN